MEAMNENKTKSLSWAAIKRPCLAFLICILIVGGTFNGILSYVAFLLSALAIVMLPDEDSICLMMLILSFANIFKSSPDSQSFFTYLMLLYVLCYFVKKGSVNKQFLYSFGVFLVFLMFQIFISVNILRTIKFVSNILLIYVAANSSTDHNTKKIFLFYIIGVAISSSIAALDIIPNLSNYIGEKESFIDSDYVARFSGMYGDPNYYAVNVIIALCLVVILNHRKELSTALSVCLGALMVVFVGLTMSKSAFLMLILPLLLLLYSKVKNRNYIVLLCVIVAGIATVTLLFSGKIEIFNDVLYRLNNASDIDSLTTGRSYLWQNYIDFLLDNPNTLLFGGGFGAELVGDRGAHNTYIDLIYYLGIIGTSLLAFVFGALIGTKKKAARSNLLNYSIWICIAVMYLFLSQLFYFDWPFHIIIAIWISKMNMTRVRGE